MYEQWFRLDQLPFRLAPDPQFLYLAGNNRTVFESLGRMADRGGVIELVGEPGLGKTLFLDCLAEALPNRDIFRIVWPDLTGGELLGALHSHYRLPEFHGHSQNRLAILAEHFRESQVTGRRPLLFVDEAHQLSGSAIQDLFAIALLPGGPTIFAAGQSKLILQIESKDLVATAMVSTKTRHLARLKPAHARAYIEHRLAVAHAPRSADVFARDATAQIHRHAAGIPRLINILCDCAMYIAADRQSASVSQSDVITAVRELRWTEYTSRPNLVAPARRSIAAIPEMCRELHVTHQGALYARLELQAGKLIVGRAPDCGLRLDSNFISREHMQIVTSTEGCYVRDLGSTNGIAINGMRVRLHQLQHNDVVDIAEFRLTYQETVRREGQQETSQESKAPEYKAAADTLQPPTIAESQPPASSRAKPRKTRPKRRSAKLQ